MEAALVLALLVFVLFGAALWFLLPSGPSEQELLRRRLAAYAVSGQRPGLQQMISVLRRKQYSRIPWLDALLARLDVADALARELSRAAVPLRVAEFLLAQVFLALAAGAAVYWWFGGQLGLLLGGSAGIVAFLAPLFWLRWRRLRRVRTFERDLPEALDLIAGSLRAGYGLAQGLDLVARENPGPCGQEFGQVLEELNLGQDLELALARLVMRIDCEDARLLATAVAVQRRTGGNLVEVLGQMSEVLRDRERLRRDVRVLTTAPRVSGYVVALLPVLTLIVMYFTSRYYVELLFGEPLGRLLAAVGAALTLTGLYLNHRIAQVDA